MIIQFFRHIKYDEVTIGNYAKLNKIYLRQERKAKVSQKAQIEIASADQGEEIEMADKSTFIRMPDRSMFPLHAFEVEEDCFGLQFCKADYFEEFL